MWMKKCVWVVFFLLLSGPSLAEQNPYKILQEVATKTFSRIKAEQAIVQQDPEQLKVIVEDELLPYIDYKFAGAKVLGKHFKSVPRNQIPLFFEEFRKYLIATYAVALAQYEDQDVLFEPEKDFDGKKAVTVRALIKDDDRPDIKIAFKVRRNSKTKEWKAYDMVAEGISVLSSKRSEFESILRQEGIERVIAIMQEKNAQKITLKQDV